MAKGNHEAREEPAEHGQGGFPIVGLGGSAGSVDALKTFFSRVDPQSGLAFVVVQHLDPTHKSMMPELLARSSKVPVGVIEEDTEVAPNNAYVIPPNATLRIKNGRLHLGEIEPRDQRTPIDTFFASLAEDRGEMAACVVLSGTGSDGTVGLRAIKDHGGMTLAQAEAEYDGMMRSAVATGLVDFVLPAHELPARLAEYFRHLSERGDGKAATTLTEAGDHLNQICAVLRARTGHDFSGYKDKTVIRRVQRRMQVLQLDNVPSFLDRLRREPREVDLLFQDLLIGVTSFFRDPHVFQALQESVVPRLFEGKGADDTIRVWVPGCSTGEEAYSIAILLREHQPKRYDAPRIQIFASDIDELSLDLARTGRYPASIAKDVSTERLERFLVREDGTYRVASELRELCLFSLHNLLRDAPFSKLDLISCRNLMIYLAPQLQNRLVPLLHYALRDEGFLLLGTSENVTRHSRLFGTFDKAHRIFRRRLRSERALPEFPLSSPEAFRRRPNEVSRPMPADGSLQAQAERHLIERYAPAYVLVNGEGEVLHVSGRTGKYLELPAGSPSHNIFNMARRGLKLDLRAAFHKAVATHEAARQSDVSVGTNGGRQIIDLIVQPVRAASEPDPVYMVVFQDVGEIKPLIEAEARPHEVGEDVESVTVRQLENELRATKERLQTATEELESSNEELKSGNEELSSINEELQSANEELETSKEELQSINEELQTLNAELKARVDELSRANSDIANLLESTQIATLFLDNRLAVKSFTPAAKDVFRLVESDTGRPISHVRPRIRLETIEADAERVLRTLGTIERQVETEDGAARFSMRMMPYRTVDNVIAGLVITFIDVTKITAAEERIGELSRALRDRVERLETLLDLVPIAIFVQVASDAGAQVQVNRYAARLLGDVDDRKGPREVLAKCRLFEGERELRLEEQPLQRAARTGKPVTDFEGRVRRADGSFVDVMMSAMPLFDEGGAPRGAIAAILDISPHKQSEATQRLLLHELQHRVKNLLTTVSSLAARMLKDGGLPKEFAEAFLDRLRAMGAMHELLAKSRGEGAELHDIVKTALAEYGDPRHRKTALRGPPVMLKPDTAASFGLVLHELATNAAKYGALSNAKGRIEVTWSLEGANPSDILSLRWRERDGPKIDDVPKEGFGITFVKRSIEYELDGETSIAFTPDGIDVALKIPLGKDEAPDPAEA